MSSQMIQLRARLRALGYDAKIANGDCFDINQNGRVHYLSQTEAQALADADGHPLELIKYATLPSSPRTRYDFSLAVPAWVEVAALSIHSHPTSNREQTIRIIWEEFRKRSQEGQG